MKQSPLALFGGLDTVFGDPLSAAGFALLLMGAVYYSPQTLLYRLLNCRPLVFVGTISYLTAFASRR